MLKTLSFTLQNGKTLSSGMQLLANSARSKGERQLYSKIYDDLKEGTAFSQALKRHSLGSTDVIQFISMAEKGVSFKTALEKILHYIEVKEGFERESNDKITLPVIYFTIAAIVVIVVKFILVPYQVARSLEYDEKIIALIKTHLDLAQIFTDMLFFGLLLFAGYFAVLLIAIFSHSYRLQSTAKQIALLLPLTSTIILRFEKFVLFSMLGEMLLSGISFKKVMQTGIETTTVGRFKKAMEESLYKIKHEGKFIVDNALYDEIERGLLLGVGSSTQVGSIMLEISSRARTDALILSTKFFRIITVLAVLLMAFAVFIEFYTVVLTQVLIQKGLIDATRGVAF